MGGDDKEISSIYVEDDVDYSAVVPVIKEGVAIM
jgi:hypothetical protein